MKWSEQYATGIAALDEQHKMLFRMAGDFRETLNEGRAERVYGLMLESLADYARAHFGIEEQCMLRYQCPFAERNSAAHAEFVDAMTYFQRRYDATGFSAADASHLVEYVENWLAHHIGGIDVRLRPYVTGDQS